MSDPSQIQPGAGHDAPAYNGHERRAHERTPLTLHGFYQSRQCVRETAALLLDISPGGARLLTSNVPELGCEITIRIIGLGRLFGRVVRTDGMEFSVQLTNCFAQRKRLAASIMWHFNRARLGLVARDDAVHETACGFGPVAFDDGDTQEAEITTMSLIDASFLCPRRVEVGERVKIGTMSGAVARRSEGGFTVEFDPPAAGIRNAA